MLPRLTWLESVKEDSSVRVVGFSPATLVFVSDSGHAYGYKLKAIKDAFGWSFCRASQFFNDIRDGKISGIEAWKKVKSACYESEKIYSQRDSVKIMQQAIFKNLA